MPAPVTGQVAITTSAQPLSATPLSSQAFVIKAAVANSARVYIGPASVTAANGYALDPGDTFEYERKNQIGQAVYQLNLSDFYAVGTGGDVVSWLASP